ncbi:MAG: hypothetical protein ABR898_08165 [Terracidiphilus sp.]|jgi:hypothetical protein
MYRIHIYTLFVLVVAAGCLALYWASRLLASMGKARQTRIGIVLVGLCALAIALFHTSLAASNCLVLALALIAGMLMSRTIRSIGALKTFLIVASVADLVSTHLGPTKWFLEQAQNPQHLGQLRGVAILQYLALSIRLKGYLVPVIGFGDLLFFTVCAFATSRFGWPRGAVFAAPLAGILAALGLALVFNRPMPAIPFIAGAVIGYACAASLRESLPAQGSVLKPDRCAL